MNIKKLFALLLAAFICIFTLSFGTSAAAKRKSIALDRKNAELTAGESLTLKLTVTGYKKCTVQWRSSDSSVAAVKKGGIVTAVNEGTAEISAKIKGTDLKAVCTVTVKPSEVNEADNALSFDGKTYRLTFEDDFNGTELDETKWERCPEQKRQDLNNYWSNSMSYLNGEGDLIIETSYDSENDRVLSGAVRTRGIFEQAYGYFEIRCTVNTVPGYWTAFWLMGDSVVNETLGGRNGTEIDIMETPFFNSKEVQNTLNWDGYGALHKYLGNVTKVNVYDGEYHTFSLLWTETEYVFFIDGKESWRTNAAKAMGICEVPLYLKISAETGSWAGSSPDPASLPDLMKIDYVRVYSPDTTLKNNMIQKPPHCKVRGNFCKKSNQTNQLTIVFSVSLSKM